MRERMEAAERDRRLGFFARLARGKWEEAAKLAGGRDVGSWRSLRGQPAAMALAEHWASQPWKGWSALEPALAALRAMGAPLDALDGRGVSAQGWLWDRVRAQCGPVSSTTALDIERGQTCRAAVEEALKARSQMHREGALSLWNLDKSLRQAVGFALAMDALGEEPERGDARLGLPQGAFMLAALGDDLARPALDLARRVAGWDWSQEPSQMPLALRVCVERGGEDARAAMEFLALGEVAPRDGLAPGPKCRL